MKKFIIYLLGISLFSCINNFTYALSVADFSPSLDKRIANMKTTKEKVEYLQNFSDLLNTPKFTQDKNARYFAAIRKYALNMLNVFEFELQEENTKTISKNKISSSKISGTSSVQEISTSNLLHLSDNFSNIDEQKVRNAILSRHNEERKNIGVNPYNYNLDLEGSATTWANKLADSHKTSNLHLRNTGDGYYNYNSILNRFSGLGINFPKSSNGGSSFSETIGRNVYRCNKSDCTQDLINAIKKTWIGLIMKEKSSNGSHYRAAAMKYFTQMGAGIAIDKSNNRYYLVLHYGVEF